MQNYSNANQKGGVGYEKTTTTANLGIGLAIKGKRVLLIDADAQGDLNACLGIREADELEISLATLLAESINDELVESTKGILHHEEGIDFIPGNIEISGLEVLLVNIQVSKLKLMKAKVANAGRTERTVQKGGEKAEVL